MLSLPELKVAVDSAGKPFLPDRPDIHFSISHSDEVVMCVVADHPVGCDVERIVPIDDGLRKAIGSIAAWTLKEARFKCGATAGEPRAVSAPEGYCAAVAEG